MRADEGEVCVLCGNAGARAFGQGGAPVCADCEVGLMVEAAGGPKLLRAALLKASAWARDPCALPMLPAAAGGQR